MSAFYAIDEFVSRAVFKLEQAEYAKEKIEWAAVPWNDNSGIMAMMAKKPVGIFHLLDDESNFPKVNFDKRIRKVLNIYNCIL